MTDNADNSTPQPEHTSRENRDVFGSWLWIAGETEPRIVPLDTGTYSEIVTVTRSAPVPTYGRTLARRGRKPAPSRVIRHIPTDNDSNAK
ncbi:MAG: hypothetical protein H6815_09045 [Phycisphaeraceae bacterium]|nr:hypothetical protein [Phycisphaerales bacterium]MCB9860585.1 hypothetical protein [Phycisphaeraceae bacterium]